MKRFALPAFLILLALLLAPTSVNAITRVQVQSVNCAAASSCALTMTSTGAGNLLLAGVILRSDASNAITSVTDNQSNTYVADFNTVNLFTHTTMALFRVAGATGAVTTITANFPISTGASVVIGLEYSGMPASNILDQNQVPVTGNSASYASTAVTTTQASELLAGLEFCNLQSNCSFAATGSWTLVRRQAEASQNGWDFAYSEQIVSSIQTSIQNTGTLTSGNWAASITTYKGTVAAGGGSAKKKKVIFY